MVTSHDKLGETGKTTGYYLGEVTHTWAVLNEAGYEIDFVSPKGGNPPYYEANNEDLVNQKFSADKKYQAKIENTMKPSEINPSDYIAIFYAGGHGTMWDFADSSYPNYNVKPVMMIAGNDTAAKNIVSKINTDMGYETLDTGKLDQALHLEHMTLLWVKMVRRDGHHPNFVWAKLEK